MERTRQLMRSKMSVGFVRTGRVWLLRLDERDWQGAQTLDERIGQLMIRDASLSHSDALRHAMAMERN